MSDADRPAGTDCHASGGVAVRSYIALSDGINTNEALNAAVTAYNAQSANTYHLRSPQEIADYFSGLDVVEPGVVATSAWRPDATFPPMTRWTSRCAAWPASGERRAARHVHGVRHSLIPAREARRTARLPSPMRIPFILWSRHEAQEFPGRRATSEALSTMGHPRRTGQQAVPVRTAGLLSSVNKLTVNGVRWTT